MSDKLVEVTCQYAIERNPQDFIREHRKALAALQKGLERAILDEIERLKVVRSRAVRAGQVGSELHAQTSMLLDYLHQQLYQLFPDKPEYAFPDVSYSDSVIRAFVGQLTLGKAKAVLPLQKAAPNQAMRRLSGMKRTQRLLVIGIGILLFIGFVAVLLWLVL